MGLTSSQKNLVRIVCAIANADGYFSSEEFALVLDEFSLLFSSEASDREALRQELLILAGNREPLESLVSQLSSTSEKELALKLGYMVIQASQEPAPNAAAESVAINPKEKLAYRQLVDLLGLPETTVSQIEWATAQEIQQRHSLGHQLRESFRHFFQL